MDIGVVIQIIDWKTSEKWKFWYKINFGYAVSSKSFKFFSGDKSCWGT